MINFFQLFLVFLILIILVDIQSQPAEKWLKDRRDRELSIEEIQHYQKIIVALMETDRIMREIDRVIEMEE